VASQFYDVIVIGTNIGGLIAAGLMAGKGFRVLVTGENLFQNSDQNQLFTFAPSPDSPFISSLLSELKLKQVIKRHLSLNIPSYQVVLPKHRIDVSPEPESLAQEFDREFFKQREEIRLFYKDLKLYMNKIDKIFQKNHLFHLESPFKRWKLQARLSKLILREEREGPDIFRSIPKEHPFKTFVLAQVILSTYKNAHLLTNFEIVRLHGAWLQGTFSIKNQLLGLKRLLMDKITNQGGDIKPEYQVQSILMKQTRAQGIKIKGIKDGIGCEFIISSIDLRSLSKIIPSQHYNSKFINTLQGIYPTHYLFIFPLLVKSKVIPEGMAREVFFVSDLKKKLEEENLLRIIVTHKDKDLSLITVGCLSRIFNKRSYYFDLRKRAIFQLEGLIPFLREHIKEEEPLFIFQPIYGGRFNSWFGFSVGSSKIGYKNIFLAGREVFAGLGFEGEFLSGRAAVWIAAKKGRRKEQIHRKLRGKLDM
jgi:phytoene dehydrogenase-like protein